MSLSIPASESIASTSPSTHSPFCLLFLLDGLLSLDDVRIHDALIEMNRLVYHATSSNNRKDSDSCPPIELLPKLPPNHRFKRNRIEGDVITTSTKTTLPQSLIPTTSSSDNPTTSPMLQYPSIAWKFTSVRRRTNAVSSASVQLPDAMMNNDTTTEGSDDDANNNACEEIIMLDICALLHIALDACPQLARSLSLHDGSTPLHFAASLGYVPIANVILQSYPRQAATPNVKGKIPLHYAAREGRIDMVHFFLQRVPYTASIATEKRKLALHFAAGDGHANVCRALLAIYPRGAALPSAKGKLPLHFCARWGYLDVAHDLIQVYPDSVRALDWEGNLPLHDAARQGQLPMARYLLELFPMAISTVNLRNEIPLFSAVRSGEVDLVAFLIQSWPASCRCILQNLSADDNLATDWMSWSILELLLRGAVQKMAGCPLLQGVPPPTVRLVTNYDWRGIVQPPTPPFWELQKSNDDDNDKKAKKQKVKKSCSDNVKTDKSGKKPKVRDTRDEEDDARYVARLLSPSHQSTTSAFISSAIATSNPTAKSSSRNEVVAATAPQNSYMYNSNDVDFLPDDEGEISIKSVAATVMRSKSPILQESKFAIPMSHQEKISYDDDDAEIITGFPAMSADYPCNYPQCFFVPEEERKFVPLHAALESAASCHVIQYLLSKRFDLDVNERDERGMLPIHWAVTQCNRPHLDTSEERNMMIDMILEYFLNLNDERTVKATTVRDLVYNRLPLHFAVLYKADIRIIQALIKSNPSAATDNCFTRDMFYDKTPLYMATHCNCSLDVVYELLKVDPGFVTREQQYHQHRKISKKKAAR